MRSRKSISKTKKTAVQIYKHHRITRILCFVLCFNLLSVSVPAAPQTIVGAVNNFTQDVRFGFFSGDWAVNFPGWFAGAFLSAGSSNQNPSVARIQILPGSVTVNQGEQVIFSAIGYDAQNEPLSGLDFKWKVSDTGRGRAARPLLDSRFKARIPGTFTITVKRANQTAQATVTVNPSTTGNSPQSNLKSSESRTISSRSSDSVKEKDNDESNTKDSGKETESGSSPELNLPEDGGWNDGNWQSFDDPGNNPGNPPGHPADDGAGSGNFQLSAPVISLPGRGIDLALNLNYNSRLWNKSGSQLTYDIDRGFPSPGWSLGFGKVMDLGANGGSMIVDADGTRHGFTGSVTGSYFSGHTSDGTFIDYNSTRLSSGISTANVNMPNGTSILYGASGNGAVYPTRITDANGNYINITYKNNQGPNIETVSDTMGRIIFFNYDSAGHLLNVTAPRTLGFEGGRRTRTLVRFHYRQLPLNYSFAYGTGVVVRDNAPWVLDAVYYPATRTGYWFGGADPNSSDYSSYYSTYGMLTKVQEQRGMNWQSSAEEQGIITAGQMTKQAVYNYPLTTANDAGRTNGINLSDAPTYEILTESWDGMDDASAVTTYNLQQNAVPRVTTIMQPNGAVSRQYAYNYSSLADTHPDKYKDGLVYQDETYVPDANGITIPNITGTFKLASHSVVTWAQGEYESPRPSRTEVFDDENNQKVTTEYDYTGGRFNQVTRSCDYDNAGVKMRCSVAQYENSPSYIARHHFNLVTAKGVENPDGTKASWTEYEYDNYQSQPLANTPGVIQHDYTYDPYTTETRDGDTCLLWEEDPSCDEPTLSPCQWCIEYEQVNAYDPSTAARGNVTKVKNYTDAQNHTGEISETRSYDITGNMVTATTSCCQQMSFQYTSATQYAYPESRTRGSSDPNSPDRVTTSAVYAFETGLVTQATDANGNVSNAQYDSYTLRPTISSSSTGAYTANFYDDAAMTVTEEVHEAGGNLAGKSIKYLNGLGQVKREEALGANNIWDIVETRYNKLGQVWKQSRPFRAGDAVQWTETIYDTQGRTTKVIEPDGNFSQAFYNETQRPDSASNLPGNTMRVADAWGRERWGRYDQQGRLAEVVEPNPNANGSVLAAGSLVTKYNYDTVGRLVETEQGVQQRRFKYDSLGRLTRQKLAEQTATLNEAGAFVGAGQTGAQWSEAFIYDTRSNLTQRTDARGVKTNFAYYNLANGAEDALNRLQAVIYDSSGPREPNLPINAAFNVTYEYMPTGDKERIKKIESPGLVKEEYSYDAEGRVSDYTQTVASRESYPMTTSYLYDTLNRVTDVRYPAQYGSAGSPRKVVQHTFDVASRLTSLKVDGQQQAADIVYNASDQTTSINIGVAGANQVNEDYTFDPQTGLLTNQKVQRSGQTLLDLSYDYQRNNSVGNLNGKTGHLSKIINNLDNNKNREYEYDALGRLTKAKGGNGGNLWQQQYSYDRYGNRTSVTASGVAADNTTIPRDGIANLTYNATSNRITTAGFEYDVAGNQTRALAEDGSWLRMEYDSANRLSIVKRDDGTYLQAFQYSPSNGRLMNYDYISGESILYANLGGTTLSEYHEYTSAVPTWTKSYVYLGDSQLSTITPNGTGGESTEFNHPDRLGTRTITNQATGSSYEQTTLPFGTALNAESTTSTSKRFTSYDRSARTGLDYAVNRTYDSKQGRFTSVDPIGIGASSLGSPQTLNLYAYCGNDPINNTDPSGLFWGFFKKLFKWVLIAIAVVVAVLTIVAVPATLVGILSAISAGANAASQVLNALGFKKAGLIFGLIAIAAGFGSVIAGKIGNTFVSGDSERDPSWFGVLSGVGAVANILAQTKDKKRRKRSERSQVQIITDNAVAGALARLKGACKKYIEGTSGLDAKDILEKIQKRREVTHNEKIGGGGGVARGTEGAGANGKIYLGDKFFLDTVGGYSSGPRDAARARQVTILHELRHVVSGITHPVDANGVPISNVPESPEDFNSTISKKCF